MKNWELLFERALRQPESAQLPNSCWRFGGGTVLMREYNHRASKDIDIFINDRQFLPSLSPRLNDALDMEIGRYTEQSNFVRLYFQEGEIDFIYASAVTELPAKKDNLWGRDVFLEHPVEVVAKKIHYRVDELKPRDIFDLAMTFQMDRNTLIEKSNFFASKVSTLEKRLELLQ